MSNSSLEFPGPEDLANYTVFTINGEPPARVSIPLKFVPELAGKKEDEAFINGAFHYKHTAQASPCYTFLHFSASGVYSLQKLGRLSAIIYSGIRVSQP